MNIAEWQDFKIAVAKDKYYIDSAAKVTGVEPRLIVACLVGEQIRLFNSSRESYKRYIGPMKVLVLESRLSYGVTGIKLDKSDKVVSLEISNLNFPSSIFRNAISRKIAHQINSYTFDLNEKVQAMINRNELIRNRGYKLDLGDLNWNSQSITLHGNVLGEYILKK
jgi:hypothetical protein